jgi:hypothetical protein
MDREHLPPLLQEMPVSYWLARHHIAQMRESRLYPSRTFSITSGMHFNATLWKTARAGMHGWRTFHGGMLWRLWPKVRKNGYPDDLCEGVDQYNLLPASDGEHNNIE